MRNEQAFSARLRLALLIGASCALVVSVFLILSATANAAAPAAKGEQAGDPKKGKELFIENGCFACHGYNGQGGSYTGVRLAPNPLPWQAIAAFIRNPRGLNPPYLNWPFNVMPPFTSKMVSDQDVRDIHAYLSSLPGPTDIKNIPTFTK